MTEHDGWLLDLYPDADGLTLWLLGDDGARRRLHHAFPVTFYAAGPFPRLRALWLWLRDRPDAPRLRRERRRDLFAGELDVLAMVTPGPAAQARLLDRLLGRFPDLDYYDADVPAPLRYAAVHGVFPLARCRVLADAAGRVSAITLTGDVTLSDATTPLNNPAAAELLLDGDGHQIDGDRHGTVLTIAPGTTARVRDVTITGGLGTRGDSGDWGGGIYNNGALTVENSTLAGNLAARGGGIVNHGDGAAATLTIVRATLSGNAATMSAGGILNVAEGGGSASLNVVNTTLSGNFASAGGGGLYIEANGGNAGANLVYATLALNTATSGGGGIHTATTGGNASVTLAATIIINGQGAGPDCARPSGSIISIGYNLAGDGTCFLIQGNDLPASPAGLLPLAANAPGGPPTRALLAGSRARNRIHPGGAGCGTAITTDQRGAPRPQPAGGRCDVGAFESQPGDPVGWAVYLPVLRK